MSRYNLDKLIRVDLITKKETGDYKYIPKQKILGLFTVDTYIKGFMSNYPLDFFIENYPGYTVEDGIVYDTPCVVLKFHSNFTLRKYFETDLEAFDYRNEITNDRKWIED